MKKTHIPLEDLCPNILKGKNQGRKLKFGVHLRNTEKSTLKNRHQDGTCLAELQSPNCFRDL